MKKILSAIFVLLLCILVVGVYYHGEKWDTADDEQAANAVDLSIAQYSDQNITQNAIIKDERFSHLAFAEPRIEDKSLFQSQLTSVIEFFRQFAFWRSQKALEDVTQKEYGVWVWTPIMQITPEYAESILDELEGEGVNAIYLSIDSYLDIYALPDGSLKTERGNKFSEILENFIVLAAERGMKVDAEAGWRNWAEDGHTYKPYVIVSFAKDFNTKHENKFRGFQYDVEPYMLEEYRRDDEGKSAVLTRFTKLVDQTTEYLLDSDLQFSVVIPHFYDGRDKQTPRFSYRDEKDYAFRHLLRVLEKKPGSEIIVMSYRNFVLGEDGSLDISKNEMETVRKGRFSTNVILAQETGDVPPAYITFHNTSKDYFKAETDKLRSAFASHPSFGGLAIHYANAFITLK